MSWSVDVLKRLAALYTVIERQDALVLQKKMMDVAAVELALEREGTEFDEKQVTICDSMARAFVMVEREIADRRREALANVLAERREEAKVARSKHVASRMKLEQVNGLLETANIRKRIEAERQMQMLADDRFLSRGRWLEMQVQRHE